jgi:hypothetical protein
MTNRVLALIAVASAALAIGCGDDGGSSGSSASPTVGTPGVVSPSNGAQVSGSVTLTVTNAPVTGSSSPTVYTFQVAGDSGFGNVAAQATDVPEGSGGQTTWTLGSAIASGQFFWRARAASGGVQGPYSPVANFNFTGVATGGGALDTVVLYDSLQNGTTLGVVKGGQFTPEGWLVEASSNSIVYDMQTIETGFFEFDIKGLDIRNPSRDARHLFFMWDPSLGSDMTENRYRVSLQKLDGRSSINDRWLRLRHISQGRQTDVGSTFRGWVPEQTFRVRSEWGREGDVNVFRLFIDGNQIFFFNYARPYNPAIHRFELGAAGRAETPEGAIYSNVTIGTRVVP